MWHLGTAEARASLDAARVSLERVAHVGIEDRELFQGAAVKADSPRQAIHGQRSGADEFAQGAARDAEEDFELESAILAVTEAKREGAIARVVRVDQRDAMPVAADADRPDEAGDGERAARRGQATAEEAAEEEAK